MPEAIAGIALPEGRPGASDEVAQTLTKAAGGFERTAATAQRAVAQVPTWQGLAAINFRDRCGTYEEAAKAAALACDEAAASVRRYGSTYDEAYARIERLQAEAEHCLERLKDAERRAAEAAGREQAARERATAAALRSPLDGGVSLAEHAAAQAEADGAADDRRRYEAEAQAERTELERLQAEAAKEHERIREAGREAAVAVEAAAAQMPRVVFPRPPSARARPAGGDVDAAGGTVEGFFGVPLFGDPNTERYQSRRQFWEMASYIPTPGTLFRHVLGQGGRRVVRKSASTPVGRAGNPEMNVATPNAPTTIGGRDYSGHALDRMQGRGLTPTVVDDAIQHGRPRPGRGGTTVYHSGVNNVTVVVNRDGRVITLRRGAP